MYRAVVGALNESRYLAGNRAGLGQSVIDNFASATNDAFRLLAVLLRLLAEIFGRVLDLIRGIFQPAFDLLAGPVAKDLGARFLPRGLSRHMDTEPQVTLDRSARLTNVAGAFKAPSPELVRARRVLIIDDVRTTGATLLACAEAVLHAGARDVCTLVVAEAM